MMYLMFKNMPDNPLPRKFREDSLLFFTQRWWARENMLKVGGSPTGKCILNHLPGALKPIHEFAG